MIISFANQKGGVAKTTTCLNLGAGLAMRGFSTLVIDADPQASLSRYLAADQRGPEGATLGDWLMDRSDFEHVIRRTDYENLSYVPTNETLVADESRMQQDQFKSLFYMRKKLDSVRDRYDFILVDTMPSFSVLFANSLVASDQVLIPVKLEWLSVQGLPPLVGKIREVQENVKDLGILGIVGTFGRRGVKECEKCLAELSETLPGKVFNSTIQLNSKLAEAAASGKPIQHYDRGSQGFTDYEKLTEEVLLKCNKKQAPAKTAVEAL